MHFITSYFRYNNEKHIHFQTQPHIRPYFPTASFKREIQINCPSSYLATAIETKDSNSVPDL
jgi:hypothetical protein